MNSDRGPGGAAGPKLPLWDTVWLSYSVYFYYFRDVLRASWLWLVICAPLTGVASLLQWTWMAGVMAQVGAGAPPQTFARPSLPMDTLLSGYASSVLVLLAGVSIAVAWHRRLILGEHPGLSGGNVVSGTVWRYVGMGLSLALIVLIPALVIWSAMMFLLFPMLAAVTGGPGPWVLFLFLMLLALYVAGFAIVLRLCLLLPARAVGDLALTFMETWERTRGNTWRLFWGIAACTLPSLLIAQAAYWSLLGFPDPRMLASDEWAGRMAVSGMIFVVYYLLITPIMIGFLSLSYRHFFMREGEPAHSLGPAAR